MTMWLTYAGKEWVRKKIWAVAMALTLLYIGLYNYGIAELAAYNASGGVTAAERAMSSIVVLYLGLLFAQMITAFLVFFSTMGAISGEIESGLMLAVLARPISRPSLLLGKYAGMAVWMLAYGGVLFWSIVLPVHMRLGVPLSASTALFSFLLFEWVILLLMALSMLGSVYLPLLGNGVACAMLYGLAMFSGFSANVLNMDGSRPSVGYADLIVSLFIPSSAVFRRMAYELLGGGPMLTAISRPDSSLGPFSMSYVPSNAYLAFTVVNGVVLLLWACRAFQRKNIA
ncbi:MAG: ABC transporter permease [Paenibacillaceae bacterium]|nr:ABC transporter permease [Paenibacillaceae bacterium]